MKVRCLNCATDYKLNREKKCPNCGSHDFTTMVSLAKEFLRVVREKGLKIVKKGGKAMKTYIIMCGNKEEAKRIQQENWMALGKMGLTSSIDFNSSTINIADEIKLLHLTPLDSERLYGLEIEGFRTSETFYLAENSHKILSRLKQLCERKWRDE